MILGPIVLLAIITVAMAVEAADAPSVIRHLYLGPTVWAALSLGARGGGLVGFIACLVQAPFTLPAMERLGLGPESIDGLVSMTMPPALGVAVGGLVDQVRTRAARLQTVLDLQRDLLRDATLQERLDRAADRVRDLLGAQRLALVVGCTAARVVASSPGGVVFLDRSAVAWTLREGLPLLIHDLEQDPRFPAGPAAGPSPVRGLILPLDSGSGPVGALAVERVGGFPLSTRAVAKEMALQLALVVENARLALLQQRFAEELEAKVLAATDRLRQLDQAKTEFVSVVAHELRTPLTALQGFTELLVSRAVPPERTAKALSHLHREAERLGRIVAELLDVSRIESGRPLELKPEAVDLCEMIDRNIELFAAQHQGHRFRCVPHPDARTLEADRDAVDRILKNLISNAVKYSPGGGRVIVRTMPADDHPGMIEMSVEDDGVGIPADQRSRIFDKYVRVRDRQTTAVRGLGLGLALVRALTEAHGGHVEVESLPGKGSTFRVFLPGEQAVLADFPDSSA
ncbi:MAG TPA: ATP-binding protein [Candidatus Methylomirabilis sp.]|nr:ATP-binding protein [Candidatus Methylomirabilis sp.]